MMLRSRWSSEADRDLAGHRAERRITEAVDAEVEVVTRGDVRVEARVLGPRVQVATDEGELDVVRVARQPDPAKSACAEVIAHRQLAQLHVRAALHEVVARHEAVVEAAGKEWQRDPVGRRLAR